jgi:hypothetical protein
MRFHTFETAKQRLIADSRKKVLMLEGSDWVGVDKNTQAHISQITLNAAQKITNQEILDKIITAPSRPDVDPTGQYYNKVRMDLDRGIICALSEYEWGQLERPFYNVYPIVEKLVHNTKLQVSAAFLQLPYRTMVFRFAEGHEPYGIKTILLTIGHPHEVPENTNYFNSDNLDIMRGVAAVATVQYVHKLPDGSTHDIFTLGAVFEDVELTGNTRPYEPLFPLGPSSDEAYNAIAENYQALQCPDGSKQNTEYVFSRGLSTEPAGAEIGRVNVPIQCQLKSIEQTIADQHNPYLFEGDRARSPTYMGGQSLDVNQFVFKLATLVSMLHRGDNLIAPIVLAKHQERYDKETDAAARKWLEDKAAHIQGRGFSVGKELQQRSDISPHFRNPHMALYWTGTGRKEPTLLLRSGAHVMLKKIAQVPTGFMGPEQPDEYVEPLREEYVYFLREPHTEFVKIGRTRRTVAERKQQLECGIHGLILVGHIVTADCVELETRLHREYAAKRRRRADGRQSEFFELTDTEVQEIVIRHGGTFHLAPETVCNATTLKNTSSPAEFVNTSGSAAG